MGQYDSSKVLGCEAVDGLLFVLGSNQINIAMFVHQMGDVCERQVPHLLICMQVLYLCHFGPSSLSY